jgi:hypothetical protein
MTIIFFFKNVDFQYLKVFIFDEKEKKKRLKNKNRFLCVDETIVFD